MKRGRLALSCVVLAATAGAVAIACSFPDVTYSASPSLPEVPDAADTSKVSPDTGAPSGDDGGSALGDGSTLDDGSITVIVRDAGVVDDASCATKPRCDCDEDGYLAVGCDAGLSGKPGGDCDDLDPLRHPNQDYSDETTDNGDWNCSGGLEKAFKEGTSWCSGLVATGCSGSGFQRSVGCGEETEFYECKGNGGLTCEQVYSERKKQACK